MRKQVDKPDRIVARIAANQLGVVRYDQLSRAGMVPSMIPAGSAPEVSTASTAASTRSAIPT